ncbi:hypothetical protein BT96DRAFT_227298 [Gymnopus androsaceus JB14]|uniref:F-box domain-containing protein n=1 Tax=Gymnopus androsaceus JB14 TaxID=1447944 RepID=A0A6A4H699_9AGAR|nr:hypothetical protein BT96DRAFT_227298 [Gymnopus androsaceus JB14]
MQSSRALYFQSISINPGNVENLVSLLTSPHQTISMNTNKVCMEGHCDEKSSRALLRPLPSIGNIVVSLSLSTIDLESFPPESYQEFLSGFPCVESLELHAMKFSSVSQVMSTLGKFSCLQTV